MPVGRAEAIAIVALGVLVGTARAEGIGVVASGGAGLDRAKVAAALAAAIGPRERVVGDAVATARAAMAAGAVTVESLAAFRRVREAIDDGWRAYLRAQIDVAHSRLVAARREAEPLVALPGGAELYADATLRLGAVMQHRQIAEASAVIALALALDPARPVTLAEFSPDVVEAVAAVRAAPPVMQRLRVTAVAGATISVDGVERGRAPLAIDVPRGQHLIAARAPGYRASVVGANVDAVDVNVALERDDDALRLASGAGAGMADEQALVEAAASFAELDEVVLAGTTERRGGPTLLVQRCAGAPLRCSAIAEVGFGDGAGLAGAAREAWASVARAPLASAPAVFGALGGRIEPEGNGCRWCSSPLVWGGVTAVVVGAVIAIVATSSSKSPPVLTVDGRDFGRR